MKSRRKNQTITASDANDFVEQALDKKHQQERSRKYSIDLPDWIYKKLKRESLRDEVSVKNIILELLINKYSKGVETNNI